SASMVGYKKVYSKSFNIDESNKTVSLEKMQSVLESKSLKEVTVIAKKPFIERKMDKLIVNVEGSSISAGTTALEVLEKSPGVTIDKDDNISMKGKSGVLVMMDGKPTYMSNSEVTNILRNMQSNQIELIELITSPSAKYDASGTAGIINIKTKKNRSMGLNGTVTAGSGYGLTSKYNGGTNLNFRKNKVNVFGNYNFGDDGYLNTLNMNREVTQKRISTIKDTITNFTQANGWNNRRANNSYKLGADYFINKNHTIGILINGYSNTGRVNNTGDTYIKSNVKNDETIKISGLNKESYRNMAYNFNYKGTIDTLGKEISMDVDYSDYRGVQDELRDNFYKNADGTSSSMFVKNYAPSDINVMSVKADYTHPLNKTSKFELGYKSSWVKTDNDLLLAKRSNNANPWVSDPLSTNHFVYDENINAGYANYSKEFKTSGVQMGLRVEQTASKGNSLTNHTVLKRDYIEFFPSVSLSQKLGKSHQFGLSYSRRIDRPSYDNLNPFLNFLDEYTYHKGNPDLRPQFTNTLDFSDTYKGGVTASVNFSRTKDAMVFLTRPLENDSLKTYAIQENVDRQDVLGFNVYAPVPVTKWWKMNNNFQVFNMSFKTNTNGLDFKTGQTAFNYNMDNSFTVNKTFGLEASFQYQSPLQYSIFKIGSQAVLNAGFRKSFMDNKFNVKFNMNDIFNTRKQRISTNYGVTLNFVEKGESQIGRITLTYKFGKNDVKEARRRSTGLEAESNRMKN
ncbi:MAG: TonB-dependent receptor, partial [Daejeonella sp.]|nr:TonB-dependent receptor [Daejeonella sp.]